MNSQFEDRFGAKFHAQVLAEPECARLNVCFPGAIKDGWIEGLGVEFFPDGKEPWFGTFSRGNLSKNAVSFAGSCPNKISSLVISLGEGYVVQVDNPDEWKEMPLRPLMGVIPNAERGVILVWDFVRMMCLDESGVRWKTPSISWDGIKDVSICDELVHATVWDAPNSCYSKVTIDLKTGLIDGGKSSPTPDSSPANPRG